MAMSGNQKLLRDMIIEGFGAFFILSMRFSYNSTLLTANVQDSVIGEALVVALLIWFGQAITGAYYFSSITIMSMINKSLEFKRGLWFLLAQCLGCFISATVYYYRYNGDSRTRNKLYPFNAQLSNGPQGTDLLKEFFMEFLSTMFFAMFVAAFKIYKQCPEAMAAPLVGLSYGAFSKAILYRTAGLLDFFFYLAPAVLWSKLNSYIIVFILGPPLGAIAGYYLFNFIFTSPKGGKSSDRM